MKFSILVTLSMVQIQSSFAQSLYEQRAHEITQDHAQRASIEEAAFPSKANAYFLSCVRRRFGKVHITTFAKGNISSSTSNVSGIISSVDFVKGDLACQASWSDTGNNILAFCIDSHHHESGAIKCCPGYY